MNYNKPIKMPRGTQYGSNYYEFYSCKLKRIVAAYSNLEYWNQICLEMDYRVEKYCEQPLKADVLFDGKKYETIFDVWVKYIDGTEEFQEVKMADEIEDEHNYSNRSYKQIVLQKAWCEQNNMQYSIRTDKDIILGTHYINNILYLYPKVLRLEGIDSIDEKHVLKFISDREISTIGRLINGGIISNKRGIDLLAYLYYKGKISFINILNEPFSFSTEVTVNGK